MKKMYILLSVFALSLSAKAQTITNGGFETWRVSTAGAHTPKIVRAPLSWYGADSLIIANGEFFGNLGLPGFPTFDDSVWRQQLFKDSLTNAHGGTYSAKLVTKDQDTLGIFPGIMSNAEAHVTISITTGLGPITFTGGQQTYLRTTAVSAWVKYAPTDVVDSASMTVQAYGNINGVADSLIGYGYLKIGATPAFAQVTVNMVYANPSLIVDTIRITFASSTDTPIEGSTLWVDDVTATGAAQPIAVGSVTPNNIVNVYPNPASDMLFVDGTSKELVASVIAMNGEVVMSKAINGKGGIDISALPAGMYCYTLSDNGRIIQRGKVSVAR